MCRSNWTFSKWLFALALTLPCFLFAQQNLENGGKEEEGIFSNRQEERRISITTLSQLSFGSFYPGMYGGSIEINKDGIRSSSGSVILLNSDSHASAAIFEIKCPSNTLIHILVDDRIELHNELGETIICEPLPNQSTHFVSPNNAEEGFMYSVGARLNILDASFESSGKYIGNVNITLILE